MALAGGHCRPRERDERPRLCNRGRVVMDRSNWMIRPLSETVAPSVAVAVHSAARLASRLSRLTSFALADGPHPLSRHPGWLTVLRDGLGHDVYAVEATAAGRTCGYLPLAHVSSLLF